MGVLALGVIVVLVVVIGSLFPGKLPSPQPSVSTGQRVSLGRASFEVPAGWSYDTVTDDYASLSRSGAREHINVRVLSRLGSPTLLSACLHGLNPFEFDWSRSELLPVLDLGGVPATGVLWLDGNTVEGAVCAIPEESSSDFYLIDFQVGDDAAASHAARTTAALLASWQWSAGTPVRVPSGSGSATATEPARSGSPTPTSAATAVAAPSTTPSPSASPTASTVASASPSLRSGEIELSGAVITMPEGWARSALDLPWFGAVVEAATNSSHTDVRRVVVEVVPGTDATTECRSRAGRLAELRAAPSPLAPIEPAARRPAPTEDAVGVRVDDVWQSWQVTCLSRGPNTYVVTGNSARGDALLTETAIDQMLASWRWR